MNALDFGNIRWPASCCSLNEHLVKQSSTASAYKYKKKNRDYIHVINHTCLSKAWFSTTVLVLLWGFCAVSYLFQDLCFSLTQILKVDVKPLFQHSRPRPKCSHHHFGLSTSSPVPVSAPVIHPASHIPSSWCCCHLGPLHVFPLLYFLPCTLLRWPLAWPIIIHLAGCGSPTGSKICYSQPFVVSHSSGFGRIQPTRTFTDAATRACYISLVVLCNVLALKWV